MDTQKLLEQGDQLTQSFIIAEMVKASDGLDLEVLSEMIRKQEGFVGTVLPIMDPTRWRNEHKGMEATLDVCRAAAEFTRVVRASKNPEANNAK